MDIASVSAVVAAGGVIVGVVFAYLEVRNLVRARQTELLHGLFSTIRSKEFLESWEKIGDREDMGYEDYRKKYGLVEYYQISMLFEEIGILVDEKLLDLYLVDKMFRASIKGAWEKFKPIIEDVRRIHNRPDMYSPFEYLYIEMKKREQAPQ